jgi:hypothetical protein
MSVRFQGVVPGDGVGATIFGDGVRLYAFDGHRSVAGLRRAANGDWLIDLARLEPSADTVDFWVHAAVDGHRGLTLHDLNSQAGVEHGGLDVPSGGTFTLFRLAREHSGWFVTALLGRVDRQHLFEGGETVVLALDQSASMYQFYASGAVARLVAAIQEEARQFQIPALRVAFSSDQRAKVVQSTADIADVIRSQVAERHFTTGADCVVSARNALADTGSGSKITVLVTDSPPIGDLTDIVTRSRTVVAVLGLDPDGEKVDAARWARLRSAGAPVVPFGQVHQATDEIVGLLSDAVHA